MSKKPRNKIKIRKKWEIDPTTRIHADKTKEYNRTQARIQWEEEIAEEFFAEEDTFDEEL